jgi:mycoredoxin
MDSLYSLTPAEIVMYSTQHCSDCLRAKAFLEANNIRYLPVLLEEDGAATDFVMKLNNGYQSVPTIIFPDGSVLVEPGWEELKAKFSNS